MKSYLLLFVFGILCISGFVNSAPPFIETNIGTIEGLQIFAPEFSAVKYNTTFNLHVHVSNISNGVQLPNSNVDCYIHMYGKIGNHIYEDGPMDKDSNGWDLERDLLYSNFTQHGEYNAYYIWCNSTDGLGGELRGTYEVTANGRPSPDGLIIVGFCIILLILLSISVTFMVKAVGHLVDKDFDLMDVGTMWGLYFALLGINQLAVIYLGNAIINNWLDLFVKIYAFPMVILPMLAFFLSLFSNMKKQKMVKNRW